jgi:hypothetical protein
MNRKYMVIIEMSRAFLNGIEKERMGRKWLFE